VLKVTGEAQVEYEPLSSLQEKVTPDSLALNENVAVEVRLFDGGVEAKDVTGGTVSRTQVWEFQAESLPAAFVCLTPKV
jgi:hypothetical protein